MARYSMHPFQLLLAGLAVTSASTTSTTDASSTNTNLRKVQQVQSSTATQRQLLFHLPECDDAGAAEGAQCFNYIKYKLEWPECLTMSVKNCETHIKNQIISSQHALIATNELGSNIHIHLPEATETPGDEEVVIDIVASAPAAPSEEATEVKKNYYYRFDLPVNYAGEPTGYQIDGDMHFPGKWVYTCSSTYGFYPTSTGSSSSSTCTEEDMTWMCKGAPDASHCENAVLQQMNAEDIATRDKQGNYMTPWVRQISPTPFHNSGDSYFMDSEDHYGFCAWEWSNELGLYQAKELTQEEMISPLNLSKTKASHMKSLVEGLLNDGATHIARTDAVSLVRNCHIHLRTLPDAGVYCTEINAFLKQYSPHNVPIADDGLKPHLQDLLVELDRFLSLPVRMEYHIEIHGIDADGTQVAHVPKIGHHYSHDGPACIPGATHG